MPLSIMVLSLRLENSFTSVPMSPPSILTTVPLYLLFGPSRLVAYLTNIFYLGLLLGGIYLLGAHLYGRSAGLLAAFIAATFTATVNYSRDYLLEFPATALSRWVCMHCCAPRRFVVGPGASRLGF